MRVFLALLALVLSVVAMAAEPQGWKPVTPAQSPEHYQVGPGDVLNVQVYGEAGLSGPFPVNDSGELDYPLLGTVPVAGMSPPQIAGLLRDRLANGFIIGAEVTVWIDAFGSRPVQVVGSVEKPGVYYVRGTTTVLQMLGEAGGVDREGVNEIRITRGGTGGEVEVVPYEALLSGAAGEVLIAGGDVVFVPESLVYVHGQVEKPGSVAFRDQLTVSRCLVAAGGASATANLRRVTILRGSTRTRVNVRKILKGKAPDVMVQAGDQIFVEESVF